MSLANAAAVVRLGRRTIRFPRPRGSAAAIVAAARALPGVVDVVVTAAFVALHYESEPPPSAPTLDLGHTNASPRTHLLDVHYDGEDLAAVAARIGKTPRDVVRLHSATAYEVAFIGCLPGFAYLDGLAPELVVPRRDSPRLRVPAGSVAIGGPYAGVYPFASPGGWHLLGRLASLVPVWDDDGPRLAPGDRVCFREAW
ncbi:hypothetical protein BH09MYX1_BH09MYX1_38960 [soil metagenome]